MKIAFHNNALQERGVTVSIYQYAHYCETLLGHEPVILYNSTFENLPTVVKKFEDRFSVFSYSDLNELYRLCDKLKIDYFYAQKYGHNDNILSPSCKNLIHSVFSRDPKDVHGDVYAFISEWMSQQTQYRIPFVPYINDLPAHELDFRTRLGIPSNALVIGRHGGYDTFNIPFVVDTVKKVLDKRSDIWFVFLNTEKKIDHERCLYLNTIIDDKEKVQFINTCDAMLHARDYGETFGLSVLEFASLNKQIISYDNIELQTSHPLGGRSHFSYLGDNCFKYSTEHQLGYLLMHLTRKNPFNTLYLKDKFSPEVVMSLFNKVFLS